MRKRGLLIAIPVGLIALVSGGTWLYINVIRDDPPPKLTVAEGTEGETESETDGTIEGTWSVAGGSRAGYRVDEILFGQNATAVGRTQDVTGSITIAGTTVQTASFEVDMTTVASDQSRRDGQFHGRIMDTATFPTSTFTLTTPIELGSEPILGTKTPAQASGDLTLHGTTKPVTFDVEALHTSGKIQVSGSIPIVFADWGIPNPSNPAVSTEDHGELEFLLVLRRR